ncbi:hypothetical protein [Novosphingobium cyanobacteriorum]|uniref:Sulfotransferase n=1 Tax=Novosphingobium cyanobacteriorum TaxID=3024215 RepID=A0ABT6CDU2_9SPHN|nr:hypothetical protein [Novosphingobium cyanobacteriorum]MDF8332099.1 hypothetical protein [Novosphingobium cyanobacteriorum]
MLPADLPRPDFHIAAMGRSGSTMIANWLTVPPGQVVLVEPFLFALRNPDMVRVQLEGLGLAPSDAEWTHPDATWQDRFARLFAPRLAGRRWALKEVLASEHARVLEAFAPPRVVVTVRDLRDIAASFFEKHRIQDNLHRFDHQWVHDYCLREAAEMVALCDRLEREGTPWRAVRYEDFTASAAERQALANFVGWQAGGDVTRHLDRLNRGFEAERHGSGISATRRAWADRDLLPQERALAEAIAAESPAYQSRFGY